MMSTFSEYMRLFEIGVIIRGIKLKTLGKEEKVSVRDGALNKSIFGTKIGRFVDCTEILVIDYYGLWKKSRGFLLMAEEISREYKSQVKSIDVTVVHFASIRIEQVAMLTPELVAGFPLFKKEILDTRGFKHGFNF